MSQVLEQLLEQARGINRSLALLAQTAMPAEPNYRYPFGDYPNFNWGEIGAEVIAYDEYGATAVRWNGYANWTRRYAPVTKSRKASVWFSRAAAAEDSDGAVWFTLITFRDLAGAEPLPNGAVARPKRQPSAPAAPEEPVDSALFEWKDRALTADTVGHFIDCMVQVVGGDNRRGWIDGVVGLWPDWSPVGSNAPMVAAVEAYCKDRANAEKVGKPLTVAHKVGVTSAMGAYNRAMTAKKEAQPA